MRAMVGQRAFRRFCQTNVFRVMQTGGDSPFGASVRGHQRQNEQGQSTGPRASEYSPGHQAKDKDNSLKWFCK